MAVLCYTAVFYAWLYIYCTTAVHFTHFSPVSGCLVSHVQRVSQDAGPSVILRHTVDPSHLYVSPHARRLVKKKNKTTTLSIPFITAVWATGCTTAPENVVKMMIQIHILQLTLLLPIFSTWFAVFRKRERRRVCQGACRNKDLQFGNCQCCLLTVNVPPFVYGMDMADVHSAS